MIVKKEFPRSPQSRHQEGDGESEALHHKNVINASAGEMKDGNISAILTRTKFLDVFLAFHVLAKLGVDPNLMVKRIIFLIAFGTLVPIIPKMLTFLAALKLYQKKEYTPRKLKDKNLQENTQLFIL